MPRIPDSERIERLLEESEGGSLGRREIIEALGLSEQRYEDVARDLVGRDLVKKNLGRAGGLRLLGDNDDAPESEVSQPPPKRAEVELERDLYPKFSRYLIGAAKKDESRSVILETWRTKARKWETPDLAEVRVTPFPTVGQWELRISVYELKRKGGWNVDSVLQTGTYSEFAHESWLVVPIGDDGDWSEYFGPRLVDKAGDLGVGLGSFDVGQNTLKKHMKPRRHLPPLQRQQEWLDSTIERLGDLKVKEEISGHISWARRKAEAGRD